MRWGVDGEHEVCGSWEPITLQTLCVVLDTGN
jgi:hypothetical protein